MPEVIEMLISLALADWVQWMLANVEIQKD
jgi:hypothetical protein